MCCPLQGEVSPSPLTVPQCTVPLPLPNTEAIGNDFLLFSQKWPSGVSYPFTLKRGTTQEGRQYDGLKAQSLKHVLHTATNH